ncbi:hypothetical protein Droror1_Dr00023950 [Drosera rotundifolia]
MDPKLSSKGKVEGRISISAMPMKRVPMLRPEKLKKKGNIWSSDYIPWSDPWSPSEDAVLCALVHEYDTNWRLVSDTLYGMTARGSFRGRFRHPVRCAERFRELCQKYILSAGDSLNAEIVSSVVPTKTLLKVTEIHSPPSNPLNPAATRPSPAPLTIGSLAGRPTSFALLLSPSLAPPHPLPSFAATVEFQPSSHLSPFFPSLATSQIHHQLLSPPLSASTVPAVPTVVAKLVATVARRWLLPLKPPTATLLPERCGLKLIGWWFGVRVEIGVRGSLVKSRLTKGSFPFVLRFGVAAGELAKAPGSCFVSKGAWVAGWVRLRARLPLWACTDG